jgi:hypothetical protein
MQKYDYTAVHERFTKLPGEVQDAILSDDLAEKFAAAMETAGLTSEQKKTCNEQATLVLVGLSKMVEFESFANAELGLNEVAAHQLTADVKKHVFDPVRQALVDVMAKQKNGSEDKKQDGDPYKEPVK